MTFITLCADLHRLNSSTLLRCICFRCHICANFNHNAQDYMHFQKSITPCVSGDKQHRGVTRLDGARDKKQVWRPHVRTWGFSEVNVLYWRNYLWHCWDFSAPPQSFGASIVIRRPGNCSPFAPIVIPLKQHAVIPKIFLGSRDFWNHNLGNNGLFSLPLKKQFVLSP